MSTQMRTITFAALDTTIPGTESICGATARRSNVSTIDTRDERRGSHDGLRHHHTLSDSLE